jgi:hypothetical protein
MSGDFSTDAGAGVGKMMDKGAGEIAKDLEPTWAKFGRRKSAEVTGTLSDLLSKEGYKSFAEQPMVELSEEGMKREIGFPKKKGGSA